MYTVADAHAKGNCRPTDGDMKRLVLFSFLTEHCPAMKSRIMVRIMAPQMTNFSLPFTVGCGKLDMLSYIDLIVNYLNPSLVICDKPIESKIIIHFIALEMICIFVLLKGIGQYLSITNC